MSDTTRKVAFNVYKKESKSYRVIEYRKCRKATARILRCGGNDEQVPLPRRTSGWLTH